MKRNDQHRPSVIQPEDYEFVGVEYDRVGDLGTCLALQEERKRIRLHMEMTGGTYSSHEHGGNCMVCGAWAIYTALFYHRDSNSYVRTGFDCAANLEMEDTTAFRAVKRGVKLAREAKAGRQKARGILEEAGLMAAWDIFDSETTNSTSDAQRRDEYTVRDIVQKLVRFGGISERQENFLRKLTDRIARWPEIQAQRAAEREAAAPCPEGRIEVEVEVLKTEYRMNDYGETLKMLVKAAEGWLAWGTVPAAVAMIDVKDEDGYERQRGLERGDRLMLKACFKRSDRDEKFGFFSRPNGRVLSA